MPVLPAMLRARNPHARPALSRPPPATPSPISPQELQSTLDALMVLLAEPLGAAFSSGAMRPQLDALLRGARDVST